MKKLSPLPLLLMLFGLVTSTHAAEPKCQSQTTGGHTAKLCVSQSAFQHDYYTLWVDNEPIFTLPDDYIESIALTHHVPQDAAIEFPLSKQGENTVTIRGGCSPISEQQSQDGKTVGIEIGRSCSFTWGKIDILKDLQIHF